MSPYVPKPGAVLTGEDCDAIVVAEDTDVVDALVDLLDGEFERTNPVLVEEARALKVEVWRSTTKAFREAEGLGEENGDWWCPDGDGRRSVRVVALTRSRYVLADMAELADAAPPDPPVEGIE